jgi:cystathionine beta-lyase
MPHDFDRVVDRRRSDSNKWHKFGPDVLPLWVADMDFRVPEAVIEALHERVAHGVFGYGVERPEFHEMVAARLLDRHGWRVSPDAVVPLPGVIPGFNLALRATTSPGDGVLMALPVYPPILRSHANAGLTRDEARIDRDPSGHHAIDWPSLEAAIGPRTRVFLLCNPHNPVGRVFTREELSRMAALCLERNLVICADEIHGDLVFSGHRHVPIASLAPEIADRTITLMAPSKTYNLAGLKASFAVIPNVPLREAFVAARADLVQAVNILGYTAMVAAYRHGQPWLDGLLPYLEANRDFVVDFVRSKMPGVSVTPPEGTYLAWLDCRETGIPGDDPYTFFLERGRVALNDGRTFGRGGEGFVRLNFGCPRSVLAEGLERMRQALDTLR